MGRFAVSRIHQPVDNTRHRLSHGGVFVTVSDGRPATSNDATTRERNNKLLALHQRASTPGAYLARRAQKVRICCRMSASSIAELSWCRCSKNHDTHSSE